MTFQDLYEAARHLAPKSTAEIKATVAANMDAGRPAFSGLTCAEIREYNIESMADAFAGAEG